MCASVAAAAPSSSLLLLLVLGEDLGDNGSTEERGVRERPLLACAPTTRLLLSYAKPEPVLKVCRGRVTSGLHLPRPRLQLGAPKFLPLPA